MPYGQSRTTIGQRREKVQLQQAIRTDDGLGGQAVTQWRTVGEPWAKVEALDERVKEQLYGDAVTARHAYHVIIPYRTDVTPELRMVVRGRAMNIHSAVDDEALGRRLVVQVGEIQS